MNEKAIFEIGNFLRIKYKFDILRFKRENLTSNEIIKTGEYKIFKKQNPELCRLAEE